MWAHTKSLESLSGWKVWVQSLSFRSRWNLNNHHRPPSPPSTPWMKKSHPTVYLTVPWQLPNNNNNNNKITSIYKTIHLKHEPWNENEIDLPHADVDRNRKIELIILRRWVFDRYLQMVLFSKHLKKHLSSPISKGN